jgi:hypothetical protein
VLRRQWRDWRVLVGVLVLLASTALGARLVASSDDTSLTWAAARTLVPGTPVQQDDLVAVPVRLQGQNPYLSGAVPQGYVVAREVAQGELVPAEAVVPAATLATPTRLVAVAVEPTSLPGRLGAGDRVDVWAAPDALGDGQGSAELIVADVAVVDVPSADAGFAGSGRQSVVVAVAAQDDARLASVVADLVAASAAGRVVLTAGAGP